MGQAVSRQEQSVPLSRCRAARVTRLCRICRRGNARDVERYVLRFGASVDARDSSGATPLCIASALGFQDIVQLLLLRLDAKVDFPDTRGDTPLVRAARNGHVATVKTLLDNRASPDVANTLGETALGVATYSGWVEVIELLTSAGASVDAHASSNGVSQSMMSVVAQDRLQASYGSSHLPHRHRSRHTDCNSGHNVCARRGHSSGSISTAPSDSSDRIEKRGPDDNDAGGLEMFEQTQCEDVQLQVHLGSVDDQADSIALLLRNSRLRGGRCSKELLKQPQIALAEDLQPPGAESAALPVWNLSLSDVTLDLTVEAEGESYCQTRRLHRGKWLNSNIAVLQLALNRETCAGAVDRWFQLGHPHVARIFGASCFRLSNFAVFEGVSNLSLREYLLVEEKRHLVWQKLYEVALGLRYLHSRGVVLGQSLRLDNIWIGADGLAKIAPFGVNLVTPEFCGALEEAVSWTFREVLRGDIPGVASDIAAFGMCILGAVTGKQRDATTAQSFVDFLYGSHRPEGLSLTQWQVIERMCSPNSSSAVNLIYVLEHLREFAEQSGLKQHLRELAEKSAPKNTQVRCTPSLTTEREITHPLRQCKIGALSSTIPDFLLHVEKKYRLCSCDGDPKRIYRRLQDGFDYLVKVAASPRDVTVKRFVDVLLSFDRFLGNAVHQSSVHQKARSQRVAMKNGLLHRDIDQVLSVLEGFEFNSIHRWEPYKGLNAETLSGDCKTFDSPSDDEEQSGQDAVKGAVTLERPDPEDGNQIVSSDYDSERSHRSDWFISKRELVFKEPVGRGGFANVYRGIWRHSTVAIKVVRTGKCVNYDQMLFMHELRIWRQFKHPNVVKLFGACHIDETRFFVCEFAGNGTLSAYSRRDDNKNKVYQKLYEAALGLEYLHGLNVAHNDLKCDNILIGYGGSAKLIDFGLSCLLGIAEVKIDPKNQGALRWKSPEYLRGERSTLASDIYSFGMSIVEAISKHFPWRMEPEEAVRHHVNNGHLPLQTENFGSSQWGLIERMCRPDPSDRIPISLVVEELRTFSQYEPTDEPDSISTPSNTIQQLAAYNAIYSHPLSDCNAAPVAVCGLEMARLQPLQNTSRKLMRRGRTVDHQHEEAKTTCTPTAKADSDVQIVRSPVCPTASQRFDAFNTDPSNQAYHPWFIPLHEVAYEKNSPFGYGSFAKIYKGTWLRTPIALKVHGYEEDHDTVNSEMFEHELRVWYPLNHPHIVKLFGACHRDKRYFVCEYAPNGTLDHFIRQAGNANKKWQKLYEIALGLQYLHRLGIVHNDLKCDNFLIGADTKAKINDFGLSCILNVAEVRIDPKNQGAVHWRSPEYLRGESSTLASDIYSFGMCILEAVTGEPPWGRNALGASVRHWTRSKALPLRPLGMTDSQWCLVEAMCSSDPAARVPISSVVERLSEFAQKEQRVGS